MGTQLPVPQSGTPNFRPISIVAKWLDGLKCHLVWSRPQPGEFVLDGDPAPSPQKGGKSPQQKNFGPCLLWPNGWIDQDGTWHGGGARSRPHCDRWGPRPQKRHHPAIFGPCLGWPNGCMYRDTTSYGGRPQPRRHYVRWGPSSPPLKGHSPPTFGQYPLWPGWTKMPFGMEVVFAQATLCSMGTQF